MNEQHLKKIANFLYKLGLNPGRNKRPVSAILTYHGVSEKPLRNCVPIDLFREHLEYLSRNFHLVKLSRLVELLQSSNPIDKDIVVLTFDDAYTNFLQFAYPELRQRNIPASLFVPAKKLNEYNTWDFDDDTTYPFLKIMNESEISTLDPAIVELGSHTSTHSQLSSLEWNDLEREICESKRLLEEKFNCEITLFAYPYGELGDFDERAIQLLKKCHYQAAVTTHFGRFNTGEDLFRLKRISVWDDDTVGDLDLKLSGYYDWLKPKERFAYRVKKLLKRNLSR
ncbi:MAG: polysaccharide deacetylase family protein [Candidatus Helarchaeota archaeon]